MSTKIKPKFSFKLLSLFMAVLMVASSFPVAAGSAFAKDETNQISMTFVVTDTAEQPVNGATVEIKDNDTRKVLTTSTLIGRLKNTYETDENGKVTFDVDEVDVYDYTVTAKGMSTISGKINKTDLADPKKNDGTIYVSLNYLVECSTCKGTGKQNCPKCNGTGKICSTCSGTGKIDQKCPECNGVDFENCAKCLGKGTVEEECPDCKDESKQIDCPDCNGNKTVECKTCYGTKEIEARDFEFKFDGDVSVSFKGSVKNPVYVQDETNTNKVTYSSDNADNADITVDENGTITAGKKANVGDWAIITAIIPVDKENGYKAKKAEYTVTVVPNDEDSIENYIDKFDNLTYNGKSQEYIKAKTEGDYIPVDLKCQYYKGEAKEENKIDIEDVKNAGDYSVEVSDINHPDPVKLYFTIEKAPLIIKPRKPNNENPKKKWGAKTDIKYDFYGAVNGEKPTFKGGLSYERQNPLLPDEKGSHLIIKGSLELDESNEINKNYTIDSINPDGVEIEVLPIEEVKPSEVLNPLPKGYPESDEAFPENGYWYNANFMNNNNKVIITAKNKEYEICTEESELFRINSNSLTFTKDKSCEDVTIYVKRRDFDYCQTRVKFGIDQTCPTLKNVEFKTKNDNSLAVLGRILSFGNFFNKQIVATVNAEDEGKYPSGIDEDSYKMYLKLSDNEDIKDFKADKNKLTLTLPNDSNDPDVWQGNVYVNVKDKAGNELKDAKPIDGESDKTGVMATGGNSNITHTSFMIENIKPTLRQVETKDENGEIKKVSIEVVHDEKVKSNGNDVYSGDVTFKFTAEDYESGLYNVEVSVNNEIVKENNNRKFSFSTQQMSQDYEIDTSEFAMAPEYTIKVQVSDNAGNVSQTYTKTIYIDRQAPVVTEFKITNTAGGTSDGDTVPQNVSLTSYGFYFKESADVTITFKDFDSKTSYASGIKSAKIYLVDKDNGAIYQIKDKKMDSVSNLNNVKEIDLKSNYGYSTEVKYTFEIGPDFKGQIYAMAYDAVGNCPTNSTLPEEYNNSELFKDGYQKPDGDIIESLKKHNATYAINFKAPETKNKDKDGTPLYSDLDNKGINLDLTVSDTYSGIKSISVEVSAPYDTDENFKHKVTVGKNAKDSGALTYDNSGTRENDWVITDTDENLATEMKNTINITNNSNDIEVKVTLVDRASHESTKSYKLSIDKTKPEIEITYKNNDVQNGKYYQDDRTATVTVRELNLSTPAQFNITALCDKTDIKPSEQALAELIKKTYDKKNFEKFHKEAGEDGKKTEYYEFIFEIPAKTQGDYEITASVTDNAGNKSDYNRVDRFSVDTTTPFITVTFDNDQSRNGNYFATKRTATITVTDRYFDATQSPVVINSTDNGDKISAPSQSGWSKQNGKYEQSCTVDFSKDGKYSFTVDTTDLSGKQATQYTVSDFIIDNTDPTIKLYINNEEVKDGENRAYIDEVMPKVVVEDTNFSQTDTKVTITPVIAKDKTNFGYESTLISKKAKYENGMTYVFNNFTGEDGKERKYDNIYNLDVSTIDKSGHTTKAQRITFSVNRYGSVYICKPNRYYAEKPVIQVEEINVNPINFKSKETYINVISSSGKIQTLKSKDLIIQKQEASNKNWYSYLYAIPSKCFDIDDVYSIKVSSKDTAKRVSTNINDANKKDIMFTVDTTNPYFEVTNYIENENIKAESKELEIALMDDTSGVASYNISFDGQPIENVETKVYENKVNFKFDVKGATALKDAKGRQLEVKITDAAGRTNTMSENDKSTFNVRISSNVFVEALATMQDFYQKTTAFWCTVAGIVAVIGVVAWIIIAKTKKKSNENE